MSEVLGNSFISFGELFSALSTGEIFRTKDGKLNISGTIISVKDFDKLYLPDIKNLLSKYEETISPDFAPTKQLYSTLDTLSSPVLKSTGVPKTVSAFYKKMHSALKTPENKKQFEETLTEYVSEAQETPVFMLANMSLGLPQDTETSIYTKLMPTSPELLEGYGTKFSGDDILDFSNKGFIEPESPMNMLIYKSLHAQDENSNTYIEPVSYENLLDFYSPTQNPNRMRSLLRGGKITLAFSELHQEMLDNVSSSKRKEYISDLISESKENASTSEEFSSEILEYTNNRIIPDSYLEKNISGEFLKQKYLEKAISISRVFEIYKTNPEYFSAVESILTPDEITTSHTNNELPDDSLMYIPKENRLTYLQKNPTRFATVMYLFLHRDGFSITELKQLLTQNQITETLDFYIDEGSNPLRIKDLYENYLIDSHCIKNLKNAGILSDKDFKKYRFSLNREQIYQDIENSTNIQITGTANSVPFSTTGCFLEKKLSETTMKKVSDSYKLLGASEDAFTRTLPIISHIDEHKKASFLDKYKMIPLKDTNLVALVPPTNTSPIYLMTYQEAAFILYNKKLPANFSENEYIKEVKQSEKLNEDLLKTAYEFEAAKPHLSKLRIY